MKNGIIKRNTNSTLDLLIFGVISMLFFWVLGLYTKYFMHLDGFYNFVLVIMMGLYAFLCERVFRKNLATKNISYAVIVVAIYFLLLVLFLALPQVNMANSDLERTFIYALSVMLITLPISVLFDIVVDVRWKKKEKRRKKKSHKRVILDEVDKAGIFLKDENVEDIIIFILAAMAIYFIVSLFY